MEALWRAMVVLYFCRESRGERSTYREDVPWQPTKASGNVWMIEFPVGIGKQCGLVDAATSADLDQWYRTIFQGQWFTKMHEVRGDLVRKSSQLSL